ncbi:MAG: hypothetical protein CSYNP_03265 [Syntrophus sp. SKADARSKE-3]|nr:hypothetical protein [Syntrophus sp. SKADARSKE-3]
MGLKENESGVEIIAVKIGGQVCETYKALSGTFASFVDCCLRKKVLPGIHKTGLIGEAALKDRTLFLSMTGKRTKAELLGMVDNAMLNIVAFPYTGDTAEFFIEIGSDN